MLAQVFFSVLLLIASRQGQAQQSSSTTVINNDCIVKDDFMTTFWQRTMDYLTQIKVVNERIYSLNMVDLSAMMYNVPYSGAPQADTVTRRLLWQDIYANTRNSEIGFTGVAQVGLSGPNNFLVTYVNRYGGSVPWLCNRQNDSGTTLLPFNCFEADTNTGIVANGALPISTSSNFNTSARPWRKNAAKNFGALSYTVYSSKGIQSLATACSKSYYVVRNGVSQVYTTNVELQMSVLDAYLKGNIPKGQVAYIMNSSTYILYSISTGAYLDLNQNARTFSDPVVSGTANYIVKNNITTDTNRYIPELGMSMQVRFYVNANPVTQIGLHWTFVTTASEGFTTVSTASTTSTSSSTEEVNNSDISAIIDITAAGLAISLFSFIGVAYQIFAVLQKKTAMASGSSNL